MAPCAPLNGKHCWTNCGGSRQELGRRGVKHLALFGSRARRDNRPDSDIDLLIDVNDGSKFSLLDLVGVAHQVEDRVGVTANIFMRPSLDPEFRATAQREQVRVF